MSITSLGYHTFTLFLRLSVREARELYQAFQNYNDVTVIPCKEYNANEYTDEFTKSLYSSLPRYYKIVYSNQMKGLSFVLRLSSKSPSYMDNEKPCSIKATINPKIFTGIKDYVTAANQSYLSDVIHNFNEEMRRISPVLRTFDRYSLNRSDYCINFDLQELGISCTVEQMMILIQRSNIPEHFSEWKDESKAYQKVHESNSFQLKCKSMTVNCYGKYYQLSKEYANCPNIDKALHVVRFEVQYEYLKMYNLFQSIKKKYGYDEHMAVMRLLSDEISEDTVKNYYDKVIRKGDYYTLEGARDRIINRNFKINKTYRLIDAIELVNKCRGISKAKETLQGERLYDFIRSLRDLDEIGINPVTIPKEWGIKYIRNLMEAYHDKLNEEHLKEWVKEMKELDALEAKARKKKKKGRKKKK
jgi:hypothetical protein